MYYPGLFEPTSPYSALSSRQFVKASTDSLPQADQHAELCLLMNKKKMVSNAANALPNTPVSPLLGSFRLPHYLPPHFRGGSGDCSLMASPYGATHLSSMENFNPTLLEASTAYGIGPLPSYPHFPHYMANSMSMNAAYKVPSTPNFVAQVSNSFYPTSSTPYHHLYSESFTPDYLNRATLDSAKSMYGLSSEPISFSDHLKLLQESFQSKSSPKINDCNNHSEPQCKSTHLHSASQSHSASYYPNSNISSKEPSTGSNVNVSVGPNSSDLSQKLYPNVSPSVAIISPSTSLHPGAATTADAGNCERSSSKGSNFWNPSLNNAYSKGQSKSQSAYLPPSSDFSADSEKKRQCQTRDNTLAKPVDQSPSKGKKEPPQTIDTSAIQCHQRAPTSKKSNLGARDSNDCALQTKNSVSDACKSKQAKRDRPDECGQSNNEQTESKIKKTCIKLWHPDGEKQMNDDHQSEVSKSLGATDQNDEPLKTKDVNSAKNVSKKTNGNSRRRRFRSGLDMIRSLRKKTHSKSKSTGKNGNLKKDIKDLRVESKRLMVNKSLGETLLHRSARNNRLDVVRQCLESDACDVNARDNAGYTPLHECSSRGNLEVARILLQYSADVNASAAGGIRPLHDAIENNHIELVRLLLSYGADPNISTYSGSTPIQLCRSKAMYKFLKGFYSDICTERPVLDSTTLAWKFTNSFSPCTGFDIFADVPTDEENSDIEFEYSDKPLLPIYSLTNKPNSSFYIFDDILRSLQLSRDQFLSKHPDIEIDNITRADLTKVTSIQLEQKNNKLECLNDANEISVVPVGDRINLILGVETTVIN